MAATPESMQEFCDLCGEPLEEGQIGLCDECLAEEEDRGMQ